MKTQNKEKLRVTVILLVRADGKKYKPYIIFKGSPKGRIHKEECIPYN